MSKRSRCRCAMTLIELIVVISIILVIAALAAAFIPSMSRSTRVANAANSIQGWLIGSKARAKRDGLPTGLRLIVQPGSAGLVSTLQQIQQPPPLTSPAQNVGLLSATPSWIPYPGSPTPNMWLLVYDTQQLDTGVDWTNGGLPPAQWLVQPGDHWIVNDTGAMRIMSLTPAGPGISLRVTQGKTFNGPMPPAGAPITSTANWKIDRQPRLLQGEPDLQLPDTMVVDTFLMTAFGATLPAAPAGTLYQGQLVTAYDLLFAPSGQLLKPDSGPAILWVRDIGKTFDMSGTVPLVNQIVAPGGTDDQALVGVLPRSGDIQVQPVNGSVWISGTTGQVVPGGSAGAILNPFAYLQYPNLAP